MNELLASADVSFDTLPKAHWVEAMRARSQTRPGGPAIRCGAMVDSIMAIASQLRTPVGLGEAKVTDPSLDPVVQFRRYEGGTSQPTLDVIRRLAIALGSSADSLVFDDHERGPAETLRYQFEAISRMPEQDQAAIRVLLDAVIVKNQVAGAIERVAKQPTAVAVGEPVKAPVQAKTRRAQAGGARR